MNQYHTPTNLENGNLPDDIQALVNTIVNNVIVLATRMANSNSDSNSLGGILIRSNN